MAAQQFLALIFTGNTVSAALWQQLGKTTTILDQSTPVVSKNEEPQNLNEAVDLAIDQLGKPAVEVKRVLFGLPSHWMEKGVMSGTTKSFLKHLTHDLILEPLGFVVNTDALADSYRQRDHHAFVGAFLTPLADTFTLDFYANGELQDTQSFGRSGEDEADAQEIITRLDNLAVEAHRVILTSASSDEALLTSLEKLAGQSLEVLTESQAVATIVKTGGGAILGESEDSAHEVLPPPVETKLEPESSSEAVNGFAPPAFLQNESTPTTDEDESEPIPDDDGVANVVPMSKPRRKLPKLAFHLPAFRVPTLRFGHSRLILVAAPVIFIFLFVASVFLFPYAYAKLSLEVTLVPEELRETTNVIVSLNGQAATDSATPVLAADMVSTELTKELEVPTTGKKITGEKAKGTVTIYNKTDQPKSFPSGTKLTVGKLVFLTDNEVTVASASTTENSGSSTKTFGTKDVAVTANTLGPESNIAKEQELSIANFGTSSYSARNAEALAGGTSREIQAVAKKDIDTAVATLRKSAAEELNTLLREQGTDSEPVVPLSEVTVKETDPSAQVGDERANVTVRVTLATSGLKLHTDTLLPMTESLLADRLAGRTILPTQAIRFTPTSIEAAGTGLYQAQGELIAKVLPGVSVSDLKKELVSIPLPRAEQRLHELPGASVVKVVVRPSWLRPLLAKTPKKPDAFQLTVRIGDAP